MASESEYGIHSGYFHPTLRAWQSNATPALDPAQLILPVFVVDQPDAEQAVGSMPGVSRFGVNRVEAFLRPLVAKGLKTVLVFPVTENEAAKDGLGSSGHDRELNPGIKAVEVIKRAFPDLLIACDVCLCGYTDHGHCGVLRADGTIDNAASLEQLVRISRAFVAAGCDVIAPSDMMDGRVKAIKAMLKAEGKINSVSVMSYAVKFASAFYGPFRDAAHSAPAFGDRKRYQLPVGARGLARRAGARCAYEGADMLMVKPGNDAQQQ